MSLEGFHHFSIVINSTTPEINVDQDAYLLTVYIVDNDSMYPIYTVKLQLIIKMTKIQVINLDMPIFGYQLDLSTHFNHTTLQLLLLE